tara:strand:+ start:1848 stop:2075 length:228 start_codon:yes stop_codon:yes gene_type:complete
MMMDRPDICWDTLMHFFGYDKVWHDPVRAVKDTVTDMGGDACVDTLEYIMYDAHVRWNMDEAYEAMSWLRRGCPE